jgi:serine/threonine protein kinase/tetratricopeptide (TPR) repeat protein
MSTLFTQLKAALAPRYQLESELGRGGMATVYLAQDSQHRRRVAIKVLEPELAGAVGQDRFLQEIRFVSELTHPHILPLLDSGTIQVDAHTLPFYVMPFVEGESLRARLLREKQLPVIDALDIARDVASALSYAHSRGVVHRDIKPENILLTGDQAVVADFGIARAIDRATAGEVITSAGLAVGTPAYMSPEQSMSGSEVDGRSDIYSLGCVLYEMLGGEPPFSGPTANAILARHRVDPVPSLTTIRPTVPVNVEVAVRRALEKVPADRFDTASRFSMAITTATGETPRVLTKWPWLAAASVVVLSGVGAIVWRAVRDRSGDSTVSGVANRLAISYLQDLTAGNTLEEVANGLTEDLTDALGSVPALSVISSEAMKPYRNHNAGPDSLSRALEIGTLVTGSVDSSGDSLRVRIRMIDTETGQQLETIPLTRAWGDLLSVREDIVSEVARLLRRRLGREIRLREYRAETKDLVAWEMMQRAERMWDEARAIEAPGPTAAVLLRADSAFAAAAARDKNWVAPLIARGWLQLTLYRLADDSPSQLSIAGGRVEYLERGLRHAERALELQRENSRALEVRGALRYELSYAGRPVASDSLVTLAEEDLRRAVEADPQRARAWSTLSQLLLYQGSFDDADWAAREALRADAFLTNAPEVITNLLFSALNRERYADASTWCETGRRRYPNDPRFSECRLIVLAWSVRDRSQVDEAWNAAQRIQTEVTNPDVKNRWPNHHLMVAMILARAGMAESARAVVAAVHRDQPPNRSIVDIAYDEAYVWLLLNDRAKALSLLRSYVMAHPEDREYVRGSPWFQSLREDSVFRSLTDIRTASD